MPSDGAFPATSDRSQSSRNIGGPTSSSSPYADHIASSTYHRMSSSSSADMLRLTAQNEDEDSRYLQQQQHHHHRQFSLSFGRSRPRFSSPKTSNRDSSEEEAEAEDVEYLSESDVAIATPCSDSSSNYIGMLTDCESIGTGRSRNDSETLFNRSATGSGSDVFSTSAPPDVSISAVNQVFEDPPLVPTRVNSEACGKVTSPNRALVDADYRDPPPLPPRSSSTVSKKPITIASSNDLSQDPPLPKIDLVDRVIEEILETEKNYVADLLETLRQYLDPMRDAIRRNQLKLSEDDCADLFGNLEQIYSFNRNLCLVLENCRGDPVEICKCFVKYRAGFDRYTYYCTNYPKSAAILMETNAVSEFAKTRQEISNHGLPLASYLLKPVQRILKYHLLLQALLDHYPTERRGYGIVRLALETMTSIARHINETKRRRELDDRFDEIKDDLIAGWPGDVSACGSLVLDGSFRIHGAKAMRSLFLFQKTLFVCKCKNGRYEVKAVISCANLMIIESIPKEPLCFHILDYENPKNQFTVQTKTLDDKQKWSHHLKRLMLENHSTVFPARADLIVERGHGRSAKTRFKLPVSRNVSGDERGVLRKSPSYQSAIELNQSYRASNGSSSKRMKKYRKKRRLRSLGNVHGAEEDSMVKSNSLPNDSYLSKKDYSNPKDNSVISPVMIRQSQSQLYDSSDSEDSIINANVSKKPGNETSSESDDESSYSGSDYLSDDFVTAVSNVMPEEKKPDWPWSLHFQNSSNIALGELQRKLHGRQADCSTLPHAPPTSELPTVVKRLSWSPKTEDDSGISDQNSKGNNDTRKRDLRKGGQSYASLFSPLPYRTPGGQMSPSTYLFFNRKDMKSNVLCRQKSSREMILRRPVTIATDTLPSDSVEMRSSSVRFENGRNSGHPTHCRDFNEPFRGSESIITHFPSNSDQDFQTVSAIARANGLSSSFGPYVGGRQRERKSSDRLSISLAKVCLQPGFPPEQPVASDLDRNPASQEESMLRDQHGNYGRTAAGHRFDNGPSRYPISDDVLGEGMGFVSSDAGYSLSPAIRGRHSIQNFPKHYSSQAYHARPSSHPSRSKSLDPPNGDKGKRRMNQHSFGHEAQYSSGTRQPRRDHQDIRNCDKSESQPNFDYVTLIPESELSKPYEVRNVYMVPRTMASHVDVKQENPTTSGASWVTEMVSRFQKGLK